MITVDKLSYSIGHKDLYENISFSLEDNEHCAFIGSNGTGKSTLVNMLLDPEEYMYQGKINFEPHCRMGYISQFSTLDNLGDLKVLDYLMQDYVALQDKLASICTEMETATDLELLLEEYQNTLDQLDAIGGDNFESMIDRDLNLADLSRVKDLKVSVLSGGEFKLVQVIKEMLKRPNLMIMDEPDVFLDFEHLIGLRNLVNSYKGTLLIITHNRYLLSHCFNKILHLENMDLQEFQGNYLDYRFSLLQQKVEVQELAVADTEEIERNAKLIDNLREIATNNSNAARGRSLKARVKLQERLEARRIKMPFVTIKSPNIVLHTDDEVGEEEIALELDNYGVAFEETLLENVDLQIKAGEKVALIGPNGTGKTTLLRDITKKVDHINVHDDITLAYLSQVQDESLTDSNTLMNEFHSINCFEKDSEITHYLDGYGFKPEDMNRRIATLSGGEKNMLQLAKIAKIEANFLLLDEPTSHLDTYAQLALENAVKDYNGTVLMVSHDYYTIANCVDYVLLVENQGIRRISNRKFRKMIYANHFNVDYLQIESKKKELESRIEAALEKTDFETAKALCEQLEPIIAKLH